MTKTPRLLKLMEQEGMYKISLIRVRDARVHLEWSQNQAHKASNASLSTHRSFENRVVRCISTMSEIREAIEKIGVELNHDKGAEWQQSGVKLYQGLDCCDKFFDDMSHEIKERGGNLIAFIKPIDMLTRPCGVKGRMIPGRMELVKQVSGVKCLVSEAIETPFPISSVPFRTVPKQIDGSASFYVYRHTYAPANTNGPGNFSSGNFNLEYFADICRVHFSHSGIMPCHYRQKIAPASAALSAIHFSLRILRRSLAKMTKRVEIILSLSGPLQSNENR
jgi:hypothetical protein